MTNTRRSIATRFAFLAALGLVIAAVAAGIAFARSRTAPLGTGVVVIDTNLAYEGGQAEGTGMVLTSSGEILTNNHVIRGATTIKVVLPGTGRSYTAKVVGYDVTADVAVLQATGASNLKTVSVGSSNALRLGQAVSAVGNAGGTGSLVTGTGTITGLARTITVSDESGGTATLRNLIETNAGLQAGDSGGPLLNAAGKVVGMDTAASVSGGRFVVSSDGYAIPIARAIAIAKLIAAGKASAAVHVGPTAFLGIAAASQGGALVTAVVPGSPADTAGLAPGDLVTAIGGKSVTSPVVLGSIVRRTKVGTTVSITYLDASGASHTTHVTFVAGPPQ